MTDGVIGVADLNNPGTTKNVETSQLTSDAGLTINRQRFVIGDPTTVDNLAGVSNSDPPVGSNGVAVRLVLGDATMSDVQELLFLILHELKEIRIHLQSNSST